MSVLRTGVYANNDTPIWEDAGGGVALTNGNVGGVSNLIPNGENRKFYDIVPPASFVGKACRITFSGTLTGLTMETGTTAQLLVGLVGIYNDPNGGTATTQSLQSLTAFNTALGPLSFNVSMVIVPSGDADYIGVYIYNFSGVGVASVEMMANAGSIELIDAAPVYTQSIVVEE